ncbi:hypothetical protein [Haloimpatiens lingqiaonensis]|uniref:hypothetical protein n=1 Tax=Haloimpatiens lingqiaonensis TaxID=1380675 RepID=UPI0010FE55F0|nr:hypothetical protein [Haloimpatiens lingqiaonensis]
MAINPKDFIPRPGFVNRQGCLPDPDELCCIQVPKIFDQCLIKRCLKPVDETDLCQEIEGVTDPSQVKKIGCCRNFDVDIISVSKSCIKGEEGYKRVTVNFTVTFKVDVLVYTGSGSECGCESKTLCYEVNQTITVPKFYCPEPIAEVSISKGCICNPEVEDADKKMIKLEVIADCLRSELVKVDCTGTDKVALCITLGLFIIVKNELLVQLLIPCYGYCPIPNECPGEQDPCTEFMNRDVPDFYPPQKMDSLFPDYIDE